MNIFLTGSNGYLGRNFLKKAIKKGHKIFAVTRKRDNEKIKNVKWLVGSIDKDWKELKNSEVLVHLAAEGVNHKLTSFEKCYNFNVLKSSKLINNALNYNCKKWLIVSSKKEKKLNNLQFNSKIIKKYSSTPDFNYAFSKALFSKICLRLSLQQHIKCRIIRLFHVYGGDEKKTRLWPSIIHAAKKNKNFKMTSGKQITDFNYIDDVTDGLIEAINFNKKKKKYPQQWDMASGKKMSVKKFASLIWKHLKPSSKILYSKIKFYDKENYKVDNKIFWKLKYTKPEKLL